MFETLNRWLPSLTLSLWGVILLYFYYSARLAAFLHPFFRPGVMLAGWALLVLAVIIGLSRKGEECCDDETMACGHSLFRFTWGKFVTFGVLILPVTLSFFSTNDGFSLTTIENRGVITDIAGLGGGGPSASDIGRGLQAQSEEEPGAPLKVSVFDLLYGAQDPNLAREFEGRTVEVIGQLMPAEENNPRGNRMRIVRMFMSCCASDARPIAVVAEFKTLPTEPEMAWIRAIGVPHFVTEGGRTLAVLKVSAFYPAEAPDESMLF